MKGIQKEMAIENITNATRTPLSPIQDSVKRNAHVRLVNNSIIEISVENTQLRKYDENNKVSTEILRGYTLQIPKSEIKKVLAELYVG